MRIFRRTKKISSNNHKPNAMIIIEKKKKRVFRYVREKYIPSSSFEKNYNNNWVHILGLDTKGQFWPIMSPAEIQEGRLPTDLYMAKHCANEVEEVYGMSMPLTEKIKLGIFVGLIIAILIVIFLITASSGRLPS